MKIGRLSFRRFALVGIAVFAAVSLFTFLVSKFKGAEETEAADLSKFDPGYIISDFAMGNYSSMSEAEIQKFLTAKNPCANTDYNYYKRLSAGSSYTWHWKDGHFVCLSEELFGDGEVIGKGETAAHIIWQAAQDYKINPQVLIVLLQKETGLVTDPIPNNGDYRKATGYGCPDTAPCSSEYYGFKNQIRKAAALFRTVLDGGWTNYPLGNNYVQYNPSRDCGGTTVNIRSLATSALYRYTPYQPNAAALAAGYGTGNSCSAYGNRNFYQYFEDWFGGITVSKAISAPRNLKASLSGDGILISWDAPSDAALYGELKYEVVIADDNKKEYKVTVDGEKREYLFEDFDEGTYIAASVKAVSSSSATHARITFNLAIGELPEAPTNLNAEKEDGGIKISWKAPSNTGGLKLLKYEVVIADVDKNETKIEVEASETSATFYGLALNEYIAASVKAINAKGGKHSRITFSIKNYAELDDISETYTGFSDMPTDTTSKNAVSWAVNNGITDKNSTFNGENSITRRQAMVLLWRLAGQPEVETYTGFSDMPTDTTSKNAVSWAVNNGITDKNSTFNGENSITRRQAMVLLWRMAGQPEVETYTGFSDMPTDTTSKNAVSWAVNNGITDKNATFDGEGNLSRRQAMVLLMRFYQQIVK